MHRKRMRECSPLNLFDSWGMSCIESQRLGDPIGPCGPERDYLVMCERETEWLMIFGILFRMRGSLQR